jgi:hypothetical protein
MNDAGGVGMLDGIADVSHELQPGFDREIVLARMIEQPLA